MGENADPNGTEATSSSMVTPIENKRQRTTISHTPVEIPASANRISKRQKFGDLVGAFEPELNFWKLLIKRAMTTDENGNMLLSFKTMFQAIRELDTVTSGRRKKVLPYIVEQLGNSYATGNFSD